MKGKCYVFSGYKQRNKGAWCISNVKMRENGRKNIFRNKQTTKKYR